MGKAPSRVIRGGATVHSTGKGQGKGVEHIKHLLQQLASPLIMIPQSSYYRNTVAACLVVATHYMECRRHGISRYHNHRSFAEMTHGRGYFVPIARATRPHLEGYPDDRNQKGLIRFKFRSRSVPHRADCEISRKP